MKHPKKYLVLKALYGVVLIAFTTFVLLDTFVIPRSYVAVSNPVQAVSVSSDVSAVEESGATQADVASTITDTTFDDGATQISISTVRAYDSDIYVADIQSTDTSILQSALADDIYGKNVTETVSDTAQANNAILAINGDFYGARTSGYVIRGGVIYRDTAQSEDQEDLVLYDDGSMDIITEGSISALELLKNGAMEVYSFGPGLIDDGEIVVDTGSEVDKAKNTTNPRTAIGEISEGHYVIVVADGRTDESEGLSLYEMAEFMESLGCETAYNLDGGGSSTLYFNGDVINQPTTNGRSIEEREVSDIVYIAK